MFLQIVFINWVLVKWEPGTYINNDNANFVKFIETHRTDKKYRKMENEFSKRIGK